MPAPEMHMLFPGLSRFKSGADIVLRGVSHRVELAALEGDEVRHHAAFASVLIAAATAAFALAGVAATLLIAAIFWDTPYRVTALVWLTSVEIVAGVAALVWLRQRCRHWRPWAATREQIHHDAQCLRDIFQTAPN